MKILIETIAHPNQRYDTCGDWTVSPEGNWYIKESSLHNWKQEILIAIHELVEMTLCRAKGITAKEVDDFDLKYEKGFFVGTVWHGGGQAGEPGDDPEAPYYEQHQIASVVERLVAIKMGVDWLAYSDQVDNLVWNPPAFKDIR